MKTINVLLGCAERRMSNPVEVLLHDVCFNYATINCAIVGRIDEFVRKGCLGGLDLLIIAPDNLRLAPGRRGVSQIEETVRALQTIKSKVTAPLIVVGGLSHELQLMEAGAEAVVGFPLRGERMREVLCQTLRIPEPAQQVEASQDSFGVLWWRRLQKLVSVS